MRTRSTSRHRPLQLLQKLLADADRLNDDAYAPTEDGVSRPLEGEWLDPLRARWWGILQNQGLSALDDFVAWEDEHVRRFGRRRKDETALHLVRQRLCAKTTSPLDDLLRLEIADRLASFEPSTASEAEMALTVCAIGWCRLFGRLTTVSSLIPTEIGDINGAARAWIEVPERMWELAGRAPSRDRFAFELGAYVPILVDARELLRDEPEPWASARKKRDLLDLDDVWPALVVSAWVKEVGIAEAVEAGIRAEIARVGTTGRENVVVQLALQRSKARRGR